MSRGKIKMDKIDKNSLELWKEIAVGCDDSDECASQMAPCRLLEMPPEILEQIFQNVDRTSRTTLRLVCRHTKKFIDNVMGMYLVINDQHQPQEALDFFSRIVIRKAVIENATLVRFHSLFKIPHSVDAMFLDGEIQASFLLDILKSCSKLRILILLGEIQGLLPISDDSSTSLGLFNRTRLCHLQSIDFRIAYSSVFGSVPYEDSQQTCFNMMNFLKLLHAPNLETCCLDSWITLPFDEAQVTEILVNFLSIHHKTLKGLLISFRMVEKDFGAGRPDHLHLQDKKQRLALKLENLGQELQLSTCIISSIPWCNLWGHFLKGQKSLETMSFCDKTCSWAPCEAPLRNNWEQLQVIYILMDLQCQLDFAIFSQCCRMRELILINASVRDMTSGAPKDVCGLEKILLCKNLNFCAFSNLIMDREELWKLIKLEKLESLALLSSGFGYDSGVSLELLQGLLTCKRLNAILIDGTVAVDMEEADKIYEIIQRLSEHHPEEENYLSAVQPGVINVRPPFGTFNKWTPNPQGDGFFFNMEFDHQKV